MNVPIIVFSAFLQHIQGRMCSPGHDNVSQWNWECFFFRYMELNSRFDVMTVNVISFDQPKIVTGFLSFEISSIGLDVSEFPCYGLIPYLCGISDTLISSRQHDCCISDWEYEMFPFFGVIISFASSLRAWIVASPGLWQKSDDDQS